MWPGAGGLAVRRDARAVGVDRQRAAQGQLARCGGVGDPQPVVGEERHQRLQDHPGLCTHGSGSAGGGSRELHVRQVHAGVQQEDLRVRLGGPGDGQRRPPVRLAPGSEPPAVGSRPVGEVGEVLSGAGRAGPQPAVGDLAGPVDVGGAVGHEPGRELGCGARDAGGGGGRDGDGGGAGRGRQGGGERDAQCSGGRRAQNTAAGEPVGSGEPADSGGIAGSGVIGGSVRLWDVPNDRTWLECTII